MGSIELIWDAGEEPPAGRRAAIEEQVRNDLLRSNILEYLDAPEDLIFHHVMLSEDHHGESVIISGEEGSPAFHCAYCAQTEWMRLDEAVEDDVG